MYPSNEKGGTTHQTPPAKGTKIMHHPSKGTKIMHHPSNTPSKAGAHPYTLGGLCPAPKPNKNRTKKYLAIYPYKKSFPQPPHLTPHPCYLTEFYTGFPQGKIYIKKLLHTRPRRAIIRMSYKFKSEGEKI